MFGLAVNSGALPSWMSVVTLRYGDESPAVDPAAASTSASGAIFQERNTDAVASNLRWRGRREALDEPSMQIGHRTSKHTGQRSYFALEDADFNQQTGRGPERGGGFTRKESVLISGTQPDTGVWVDYESALRWSGEQTSQLTGVRREMVESSPRGPGWPAPPGVSDATAMKRFQEDALARIARDPQHPMRFLITR